MNIAFHVQSPMDWESSPLVQILTPLNLLYEWDIFDPMIQEVKLREIFPGLEITKEDGSLWVNGQDPQEVKKCHDYIVAKIVTRRVDKNYLGSNFFNSCVPAHARVGILIEKNRFLGYVVSKELIDRTDESFTKFYGETISPVECILYPWKYEEDEEGWLFVLITPPDDLAISVMNADVLPGHPCMALERGTAFKTILSEL